MYYSIIFEENDKGYLLHSSTMKLEALYLLQKILDDFANNDYIFSDKAFNVRQQFDVLRSYPITSHKLILKSDRAFKVLYSLEFQNSFLYHIESVSTLPELTELPRITASSVEFISKTINDELDIHLN